MHVPRLVRYSGLATLLVALIGVLVGTSTSANAATIVTLVSGGGGGPPGSSDPAVQYLDATNTWVPAVIVTPNVLYAPALPTSQYIDGNTPGAAPAPNPVVFRTGFTLPTGCVDPSLTISLHADNWADAYLNGPVPPVYPAAPNFIGGQPHSAIFPNFQGAPSTFTTSAGAPFVNPGANWLYVVLENAPPASPNNPRALDFSAAVSCDDVVPIPPPTPVFECFQLAQGQDPNTVVMLNTDNFGKDIVTVRTSDLMCETALKYRGLAPGTKAVPPQLNEVLQCFRLQKGQDPDDPAILDTSNFGPDKVRIRTSTRMCESAAKLINGQVKSESAVTRIWQCFDILDGETPNVRVILSTNNFGPHRATVAKAVLMCEMATKTTAAGDVYNDGHHGEVYQCFRLLETPIQNIAATLITRNFQLDNVRIRRANLMCEPAKKTILFDNPNDPPFPDVSDD